MGRGSLAFLVVRAVCWQRVAQGDSRGDGVLAGGSPESGDWTILTPGPT